MHAVHIRAEMPAGEDTSLDTRARIPVRQLRLRPKTQKEAEPEVSAIVESVATRTRQRAARPRSTSRLSDLRVMESITRRGVRRVSTELPCPDQQRGDSIALVRIAWARCEDAGLNVCTIGQDGIVIQGAATGDYGKDRAPRRPNRGPGVSVGVDGLMYSIAVNDGDTPALIARKLAKKLRKKFVVEIKHQEEDTTVVRLTGERLGRR